MIIVIIFVGFVGFVGFVEFVELVNMNIRMKMRNMKLRIVISLGVTRFL